ncbi:MAG: DUF4249 family protein [bacterium]
MRLFKMILALGFFVLLISCEEDFEVKSELEQGYVLTCIIRGDSNYHVATLSRTYNQFGITPWQDATDKAIKGAKIILNQRNIEYEFLEGFKARKDTARYKFPVSYYYLENFEPEREQIIEITAELEGGTVLKAETQIPKSPTFNLSESDTKIPSEDESEILVFWDYDFVDILFDPRINIIYYKKEAGEFVQHIKQVPLGFQSIDGTEVEYYSSPTFQHSVEFNISVFDKAMKEISGDDPDKENYYISNTFIQLYTYDKNLSSYFITSNYLDPYSIRLDEIDGSNVDGGYGIFGSFLYQEYEMSITASYIRSFGYVPFIKP